MYIKCDAHSKKQIINLRKFIAYREASLFTFFTANLFVLEYTHFSFFS